MPDKQELKPCDMQENVTINLKRFLRPVRQVPDGHDMDDDQYDVGWDHAVKKIEADYVTEVTMKLAWEKRAYQAEAELNALKNTRATPDAVEVTFNQLVKIAVGGHKDHEADVSRWAVCRIREKYPQGFKIIAAEDGKGE